MNMGAETPLQGSLCHSNNYRSGAILLESAGEATLYETFYPNTTAGTPVAVLCPPGSWVVGVVGYSDLQRM
jgi:hypothetical protein